MLISPQFLTALSSTMTEGKIVSWLKQTGDKVKKGEVSWSLQRHTITADCPPLCLINARRQRRPLLSCSDDAGWLHLTAAHRRGRVGQG